MAGLGRRSHYRKHLTDSVLHNLPEPDAEKGEKLGKVIATRGSNQFEVVLCLDGPLSSSEREDQHDAERTRPHRLATRQTKFRTLVWVMRIDFVMVGGGRVAAAVGTVESNGAEVGGGGGIRLEISYILYKDQVKHLKKKGIWPYYDPLFSNGEAAEPDDTALAQVGDDGSAGSGESTNGVDQQYQDNDGITFNDDIGDDDMLFVNTNRISSLRVDDSESDSD